MKLVLLRSAQKELDNLPDNIAFLISRKILNLANNPYGQGSQKLKGKEGYRIGIGDHRVVYTIDKKRKTVFIIKIGHRREIYR